MKNVFRITLLSICIILLIPFVSYSQQIEIVGTLSNFDAHNYLKLPVDNLELDFFGPIYASDILDWYRGGKSWGIDPRIDNFPSGYFPGLGSGVEVAWIDRTNPIPYCESRHFGLEIDRSVQGDSIGVQAYWTRIDKVVEIPFPWQAWIMDWYEPTVLWDVISLSYFYEGEPVGITRQYAQLPAPVPLESLNRDDTADLDWVAIEGPGQPSRLDREYYLDYYFTADSTLPAVIMMYAVAPWDSPDEQELTFWSEAVLDFTDPQLPRIIDWLVNFDLHNGFDMPFDNLELDIFFGNASDIIGWYDGCNSWGADPTFRDFPFGFFNDSYGYPLPGGVEVMWYDRINPIMPCQTRHFGLEMNPALGDYVSIRAYWTISQKVAQIPVPWQFWDVDSSTVIDIIRLSDTFGEPVIINREYAVVPEFVQLDDLVYGFSVLPQFYVPLSEEGANGTVLQPGEELTLEIPVEMIDMTLASVLVRYTVELESEPGQVVTRFINAAHIIDPVKTGLKTRFGDVPKAYYLGQNYPNPFNAVTNILFSIPEPEHVTLNIYNELGQYICTLVDRQMNHGNYIYQWNGKDSFGNEVTSGVYFYTIRTENFVKTKRLLLMK